MLWSVLTINLGYSQIDLSLEWEFQEDLSYFDSAALNYIVNDEISTKLLMVYGIYESPITCSSTRYLAFLYHENQSKFHLREYHIPA